MCILLSNNAFAGSETGVKAGYDSNIDRAVGGGMSDSYITGFLYFTREPDEETTTDWSFNLHLEGTRYAESTYLNYVMAGITPAIIFYPRPRWRVNISPFLQAAVVSDKEQSTIAAGAEIGIKQLPGEKFYTGEYLIYTDSRANVDIYSYKEKTAGVYAGINWTDAFWSEIGYDFSRGDSFRAIGGLTATQVDTTGQDSTNQSGMGQNGLGQAGKGQYGNSGTIRYSQAYNEYIINEPVDRQTIGINMGCQFTRHIYTFINYAYIICKGDAGTSKSHTATIGLGYNF